MTSDQRTKYDKEMQTLLDYRAQMECATEKGLAKGLAKGLEKGLEKGRKEGAMNIIRQFKHEGVAEEVICRVTGMTPEEVRAL